MCKDIPGQPRRRRIAYCACGAGFPDCDLGEAINHVTYNSSVSHRWTYIAEDIAFLIPIKPLPVRYRIHDNGVR